VAKTVRSTCPKLKRSVPFGDDVGSLKFPHRARLAMSQLLFVERLTPSSRAITGRGGKFGMLCACDHSEQEEKAEQRRGLSQERFQREQQQRREQTVAATGEKRS
jgi:hypothetical protein